MDPIRAFTTPYILSMLFPSSSQYDIPKWPEVPTRATSSRDRAFLGLDAPAPVIPGDSSEPQLRARREFLLPSFCAGAAAGAFVARLITNDGKLIFAGAALGGVVASAANYAIDRLIYAPSAFGSPDREPRLGELATRLTVGTQAAAVLTFLNTVVSIPVADLLVSDPSLRTIVRTVPIAIPALCAVLLAGKSIQASHALKALPDSASANVFIQAQQGTEGFVELESGTDSTVGSTVGSSFDSSTSSTVSSTNGSSSDNIISLQVSENEYNQGTDSA
jgi:hypothetical protein